MSSTETLILVTGIAATLQLCRLAVDLVATASQKDAKADRKLDTASRDELRSSLLTTTSTNRRKSSILGFRRRNHNNSTTAAAVPPINGDKQQQGKKDVEGAAAAVAAAEGAVGEQRAETEAQPPPAAAEEAFTLTPWQNRLSALSLSFHVALFGYFTAICILDSLNNNNDVLPEALVVDPVSLGCCAAFYFLAAWVGWRDHQVQRLRFNNVQRTFDSLAALLLTLGIIFRVALNGTAISTIDAVSLALVIVSCGLILAECKLLPYPHLRHESDHQKKARLSMKAVLTVLKPYFWPDATANSAFLNRLRALATWAFVVAGKACGLLAPIYIGRASTDLARGRYTDCIRNVVWYCLLTLAAAVCREAQSLVYLRVAQAAFVQLAELSFRHLHSLSLDWHLRKKLGEVVRSMDRGILACDTLIKYLFLWLIPAVAECILVVIIFATYFDYLPLAVTVFYFVFAYMLLTVLLTLWRKKFRKQVTRSDNDWHDIATDSLVNFETVKYFTAEDIEMKKFGAAVEAFQKGSVRVAASLSTLNISQRVLLQACLATALSLSALAIRDRMECCMDNGCEEGDSDCCSGLSNVCPGMEIGDFVAVLTYTINLFTPLNFLGSVYNAIVMAVVDLTNLSELLAENPDVADAKDAVNLPKANPADPDTVVEFDNVKFNYPTQPESSGLKGISFKMKRGTTTAVVGSTGAGKTTISRLLFRFYDVTGGAVKVNGVDVRATRMKDLRDIIGVVPQTATLFNDTFGSNIAYGRPGATQQEIEEAAAAAQLTTFVESLPEKWDTLVGDRGLKLSGGERQRCAIARCLLKNPPICILDEATSALDTITEASVKEALDRLASDRTVLVIAHRLGTIKNADNIIVLRDGMIHEQGTHEELLALEGQYADMWNMQLSSTRTSEASLGLRAD